ncbi:hypothetical protein D9M71_633040 [compost metagenome]
MLLLQGHRVAVQRLVALHVVAPRILAFQVLAEAAGGHHLRHLFLKVGRVAAEVLETDHGKADGNGKRDSLPEHSVVRAPAGPLAGDVAAR